MTPELEKRLVEAGNQRESENFSEAIKQYTDILMDSLSLGDYVAQIHSLCGQSLTYKILARHTSHSLYKKLCVEFSHQAVYILEDHQEQIDPRTHSIALSTYADALLINDQPSDALPFFEKSLLITNADMPEKGRLKAHIGKVKYLIGAHQEGKDAINSGLADIRTGDMNQYHIRVWETGAMNDLTRIAVKEGNFSEAEKLNNQSLQIATEHNLSIRLKEAELLKTSITNQDMKIDL